jgi:hypothetical protein
MPPPDQPPRRGPAPRPALWCCLLAGAGLGLLPPEAPAQQPEPPTLRLAGVMPGGVRGTVTEGWGAFDFTLTNLGGSDRTARVLVSYAGEPDVQYGRDVWVPARSSLASWLLVGPAPAPARGASCEVRALLYDRSEGAERLVLPPTEERVRSRGVPYRKREPHTVILLDEGVRDGTVFGRPPRPPSRADEAFLLARTFRHARYLSPLVQEAPPGPLPPAAEAFDGVDHFILASERIADDPVGMRALRRWLGQGGTVWVMLDLVGPEVFAPLLGEALDFQVVDTVGLTAFRVQRHPAEEGTAAPPAQEHEQPVDLVRVLLPPGERARHTVDVGTEDPRLPGSSWPAWFTRRVGRGTVVFTALGPRGWFRPRKPTEPPSRYPDHPRLPVSLSHLDVLALQVHPQPEKDPFSVEAFRRPLAEEIGYSVVGRGTVGLVFGGFLLATLALGLLLRRARRPELLGWLGPSAALASAGTFLALGEASRRSAAPTVAEAQVVHAVPGQPEAAVHGLLAVYHPDPGPAEAGAERGGLFELDASGLGGQSRRLVRTDLGCWHWEGLSLPAGLRLAPFRATAATGQPLRAVATFGPGGLEGKLSAGPFADPSDAVLAVPGGRALGVRLGPGGRFRCGGGDALPAGQFLPGAVLSDSRQRRQEVYRQFLRGRGGERPALLAWADPVDLGFRLGPPGRRVGEALIVAPLELARPDPGARVTVPGPLVPYQRILRGAPTEPTRESQDDAEMHLRFQLPPEVLPLRVERARLDARIDAPSRRVTVSGRAGGKPVELRRVESPLDPIRVEISDRELLRPDDDGGLHLYLSLRDLPGSGQGGEKWTIRRLELEVTGRTEGP